MAGFLDLFNGPQRIFVTEDHAYWVDVKKSLTAEDYEYAQRALIGKMVMSDDGVRSEPDSVGYQHELVFLGIVDWNLTDEGDKPLALTPPEAKHASIRRLPQSVFLALYRQINESSAPRGKDAEVSFRAGDSRGAERLSSTDD